MGSQTDPNDDRPVVLVTGFGPFQNYEINPAIVTVEALAQLEYPDNIRLVTKEVPVQYDPVLRQVPQFWAAYKPKLVVHVGVGHDDKKIQVEEQAFNCGYISKDTKDDVPCDNLCKLNGARVLKCNLNLHSIVEEVNNSSDLEVKFDLSQNPGRYLCSFIYYLSLSIDADRAIFLHVPPFTSDVNEQKFAQSIRLLILHILRHMQIIQ